MIVICILELGLKNLGDYLDLYVQSNILLLADVFENFRNQCTEMHELDPSHFLSAPGLAWQAYLKKTEVKLKSLTKIDVTGGWKRQLRQRKKLIINIWKIMIKKSYHHTSCF